jgi:hypothetical protein
MKRLVLTLLAAAALGPAFGAAAQPRADNACFLVRDVGERSMAGPHTLYFKVNDRAQMHALAYYRVEVDGRCASAKTVGNHRSDLSVGSFTLAPAGAEQICGAKDLRVRFDKGPACAVESMTRMSRVEVASLPSRLRP